MPHTTGRTHCVAFQITSKPLLQHLGGVIDHITDRDAAMAGAAVSLRKSCVCLFVLDIPSNKEKEAVVEFKKASVRFKEQLHERPLVLTVRNVDHLTLPSGHNLLYANVDPGHGDSGMAVIHEMVDELKAALQRSGAALDKSHNMFLHVPLLNTAHAGERPLPIGVELFEPYKEKRLGSQRVGSVQLLSMNKGLDKDGYYYCESEVMF